MLLKLGGARLTEAGAGPEAAAAAECEATDGNAAKLCCALLVELVLCRCAAEGPDSSRPEGTCGWAGGAVWRLGAGPLWDCIGTCDAEGPVGPA